MKNLSLLSLFFLLIWGCNPCRSLVCGEHGNCQEGDCKCEAGWESDGGNCNYNSRQKLLTLGAPTAYLVLPDMHPATISPDEFSQDRLIIADSNGVGCGSSAYYKMEIAVSGSSIVIKNHDCHTTVVSSEGSIKGDTLSLTYSHSIGGNETIRFVKK